MTDRIVDVRGAAEHNLRDLNVAIGAGLTAVVGVSGSGKSSLAFDVVYHEAYRRLLETMSLGAHGARMKPASVTSITGLGPAVSVAQNVLNRNPQSLVVTAIGAHPFLRILFSRFSAVHCPDCGSRVVAMSEDERAHVARKLAGPIRVPLVRSVPGTHAELLSYLRDSFGRDSIEIDGRAWSGRALKADTPHDVVVVTGELPKSASPARVREELERADALGGSVVVIAGQALSRAPLCPDCGIWLPSLEPVAFRLDSTVDNSSHTIAGHTIADVLQLRPSAALDFLGTAEIAASGRRIVDELRRRLQPLAALGLDHVTLDRSMPTLSRGESQRVRLAVVLAGRLEDLLHVLDEPSIGLHRRDLDKLFAVLAGLPGPVLMVEHDAAAIATADDVIEIGPAAGPGGGHLVFQGPPARLWKEDTPSGRFLSGRERAVTREARPPGEGFVVIGGARVRNLDGIDCRIPIGRLTAVTGPSGAGKTTLVREVLLASAEAKAPINCESFAAPPLRILAVDQSPIGNNPRSNPATYTKVFDRIRDLFAKATGRSTSMFTFNREEGACELCEGVGMVQMAFRWMRSEWIECESCEGRRYKREVLEVRPDLGFGELSIADVLELSIDDARELFREHRNIVRMLDAVSQVGLGYLALGQPSPTLSGGEAQRVKLARQLVRTKPGDLIVLDEPTTGLHPADLAKLVSVLDDLTKAGSTVIVVEHQPDVVAAADWIVDLGPGGGPDGGRLQHCGPPAGDDSPPPKPRPKARAARRASSGIRIRGATANNLQAVDVDIPKGKFTAVTGVSGSGKSSLVRDVLEAEADRRLLECLSMYERQGLTEGPEAPVVALDGLGPTLSIRAEASGLFHHNLRATVGAASDLDRLLAIVLARAGTRVCRECGGRMTRVSPKAESGWRCESCAAELGSLEVRHLVQPRTVEAMCRRCFGFGTVHDAVVERIIIRPDKPLAAGGVISFFAVNFKDPHRSATLHALAERHGWDPHSTPWNEMTPAAQHAYLRGDPEPFVTPQRWAPDLTREGKWRGILEGVESWDRGSKFTVSKPCPQCDGRKFRSQYRTMKLDGLDVSELHTIPLAELERVLAQTSVARDDLSGRSRDTAVERLAFLRTVGLGYLHLDRLSLTLSAGEAQRVKLASLLGSGLLAMTILLDEPSRGLHPSEVETLAQALDRLRDTGNTVIAVEHDGVFLAHADHIVEIGPGAGERGGRVVYQGPRSRVPKGATAEAIRGAAGADTVVRARRRPAEWMEIRGATENNLHVDKLSLPLGVLTGICGVSGSGKSTLIVDTLGMVLAPPKDSNLVNTEGFLEPGAHESIENAPGRTVIADQTRVGVSSPGVLLGLTPALRKAFAASLEAKRAALTDKDFVKGCDACTNGYVVETMGFLPSVTTRCDVCDGTGYRAEVRAVTVRGSNIADVEARSIADLQATWGDIPTIARACDIALRLGLGYLAVRQAAWALSGGEAQRLKLARELAKKTTKPTLYLLDEPSVGLHVRDVGALARALHEVAGAGNTVVVVDHDPNLLASCDWLVELGPGAGPDGGHVIFEGTPEEMTAASTATAAFVKRVLQ